MPSTARRRRQTVLPLGSVRCSGSWVRRPVMVMLFIAAPIRVVVGVSDKALGGPRAGWRSRAVARGKPAVAGFEAQAGRGENPGQAEHTRPPRRDAARTAT